MSALADLKMYARFLWGLRSFLRHTITLEEARATIRQRIAERESNFLRTVERNIFGHPQSPYLPLLKLAQCEFADVREMVRSKGLEDTLRALREAGVYVSFEEFKGRKAMVRDGRVIHVQPSDFDNPFPSHYYRMRTGGTSGAATSVLLDLEHLADETPSRIMAFATHGALDVPTACGFGPLPDGTGFFIAFRMARSGRMFDKWFPPFAASDLRPSVKYRLANYFIIKLARLYGAPIPWPEPVGAEDAIVVARWVARKLEEHGACVFNSTVSMVLRICVAAQEAGLDLTGAIMFGGGEATTRAKVRTITATGARFVPNYFVVEAGAVGWGCACPVDESDLHFVNDGLALIQYPRQVPGSEISVDSFHFTRLLASAPKVILNVESDDYGVIEQRSCGCPLESLGFTDHFRYVRSFSKLTGEGVTLVGSEMVRILEEVLPGRFGGSPQSYQLMEEEDEGGFTRLSLLISPEIEIEDEGAVIDTVLEALGQSSVAADLARSIWSQAGTLHIKRREPIWTSRGKLMPLHLAQHSERSGDVVTNSTESGQSEGSEPTNPVEEGRSSKMIG
jgi:hypothetical protein